MACAEFLAAALLLAATSGRPLETLCHTRSAMVETNDISHVVVAVDKHDAHLPARHSSDPTMPRAWVRSDQPGRIFIATWTDTYKRAKRGDRNAIKELAGLIAHEAYHAKHGPDEGPAYEHQIDVLKAVGARRDAVARAREAQLIIAPFYLAQRK
jgi:hypothetical protein